MYLRSGLHDGVLFEAEDVPAYDMLMQCHCPHLKEIRHIRKPNNSMNMEAGEASEK